MEEHDFVAESALFGFWGEEIDVKPQLHTAVSVLVRLIIIIDENPLATPLYRNGILLKLIFFQFLNSTGSQVAAG